MFTNEIAHRGTLRHVVSAFAMGYTVNAPTGVVTTPKGKVLKDWISKDGYRAVKLYTEFGARTVKIHQIVAYLVWGSKAFEKGIDVRHLDEDKLNCKPSNLALGTRSQNIMDMPVEKRRALALRRAEKNKGHKGGGRKLTEPQVREIRRRVRDGEQQKDIAPGFGVTSPTISNIMRGVCYAQVS